MIFGVGIDIENHYRFKKYPKLAAENKLTLFYTANEIENYKIYDSYLCYAIGFSGKEACYKALCSGEPEIIPALTDIEILFQNAPELQKATIDFSGNARSIINKHKIELPVEFNYTIEKSVVIFEAILICSKK